MNPLPLPPMPSAPPAAPEPAPAGAVPGGSIAMALGANVRAAPETGAPVLRTVNAGTQVRVFARSGNWLQIGDADAAWGWVHVSRAEGAGQH